MACKRCYKRQHLAINPKHNYLKISPLHLGEDPEIVVSIEVHLREASHLIVL